MEFSVIDHPLQKENNPISIKVSHVDNVSIQRKNISSKSNKLAKRIKRDQANASLVPVAAKSELHKKGIRTESIDITGGNADAAAKRQQGIDDEVKSLNITDIPHSLETIFLI